MTSAGGRFVITYNGEVYSHLEIRAELEAKGVRFRGRSDTEVILESIAQHGIVSSNRQAIDSACSRSPSGDKQERTLTLVRDRAVGIKLSVYWAKVSEIFVHLPARN